MFSPQVVYEHTLMSTVATLRAAIQAGAGRFVFCSSMSRYGHQQAPFTEDMPVAPADPYACAKTAAEDAVRTLCGLHGLEWVIAVPHNIYGPGQRYIDPFRNVAAIMVNRVLQGKPPVVYGDGSQRRSLLLHRRRHRAADEPCSRATWPGQVFSIGPDDPDAEVSVLELAVPTLKETSSDLEPVFYPPRPAEVHTASCSAAKARKAAGIRAAVEPAGRHREPRRVDQRAGTRAVPVPPAGRASRRDHPEDVDREAHVMASWRRHEVADFLYCPAMFGRHVAVARWYHRIHLIPGWLLGRWCDRLDRALGLTEGEIGRHR